MEQGEEQNPAPVEEQPQASVCGEISPAGDVFFGKGLGNADEH